MTAKTKNKTAKKNMNMAEHDYKLKAIGISDRATRLFIRLALIVVPVMLVIFWILKTR